MECLKSEIYSIADLKMLGKQLILYSSCSNKEFRILIQEMKQDKKSTGLNQIYRMLKLN